MLLASSSAFAYEATAFEKAELAQLSPQLPTQMEAWMTGGQTVRSSLDTMLLNHISQLFAARRVNAMPRLRQGSDRGGRDERSGQGADIRNRHAGDQIPTSQPRAWTKQMRIYSGSFRPGAFRGTRNAPPRSFLGADRAAPLPGCLASKPSNRPPRSGDQRKDAKRRGHAAVGQPQHQ